MKKASIFALRERALFPRYALAIGSVAAAFAVRLALDPLLGDYQPAATFYLAVLVSAWYGGLRPGLVSLALGLLLADWFFVPPRHSLVISLPQHWVALTTFLVVGCAITYAIESLQRARRRAEQTGQDALQKQQTLEQEIQERNRAQDALRESETRLQFALAAGHMGAWQWDVSTHQVSWSPGLEEIHGLKPGTFGGRFDDFKRDMHPDDAESVFAAIETALKTQGDYCVAYRIRRPDGAIRWLEAFGRIIASRNGEPEKMVGVCMDITERKRAESRLAIQYAVTLVLAGGKTLREAAPHILQAVCETADWKLGAIWEVDADAQTLRCVEVWSRVPDEYAEFKAACRRFTFERGIGLPGRVWSKGAPAWIPDVTEDGNFPRAPFAAKAGLHGAFGFPVKLEHVTLGIIEFFSPQIREPDQEFLEMMTVLGSQIGLFIQRERAESALREAKEQLEARVRQRTEELVQTNRSLEAINRAMEGEISERKKLERELLEITDREQRRVGQDLHDGLSQLLRGIAYLSHVLQESLARRALPEAQDATRITQLLKEAIEQAHSIARGLSPVRMETDGLTVALSELAARVESVYRVPCSLESPFPVLIQDNAAAIELYRIAQEAVSNALQHGQASRIVIALSGSERIVKLAVEDNGPGLPADAEQRNGMGLKIMNYRARMIGAVLNFGRTPGGGTRVLCSWRSERRKPVESPAS
ncbi:MAG: DUF4118 domain-containing protein [Verrucomicrobia bacterium]|nr:DUF4118 domain-containing protein [Verrucomicrobiota bacterium]